MGGDINVLRPFEGTDPVFLSYLLNSSKAKILRLVTGTTVKHSYLDDLKGLSVNLPQEKREQVMIAAFLSPVDELISQLKRKVELLKDYKRGAAERIFRQEIRFRDENGKAFPEWDEAELRSVAAKIKTKNRDAAISNVLTNSATR